MIRNYMYASLNEFKANYNAGVEAAAAFAVKNAVLIANERSAKGDNAGAQDILDYSLRMAKFVKN